MFFRLYDGSAFVFFEASMCCILNVVTRGAVTNSTNCLLWSCFLSSRLNNHLKIVELLLFRKLTINTVSLMARTAPLSTGGQLCCSRVRMCVKYIMGNSSAGRYTGSYRIPVFIFLTI